MHNRLGVWTVFLNYRTPAVMLIMEASILAHFILCWFEWHSFFCLQVFDATNTTRERREVILSFAKENGYKVIATTKTIFSASKYLHVH